MENTEFTPGVRAALVSVVTRDRTEEEAKASLEELRRLLETAGGEAVFVMMQNKETPDVRTYLGSGKAAELCYYCATNEADLAVFDCELSPSQIRNLEEVLGENVRVIDRSMLILDIFALHATSGEGKLQVELAQLKYSLPRLMGLGTVLSRLGGGIGTRGPGESQLEVDRRHIRRRISDLDSELKELSRQRGLRRARREKTGQDIVALVGYTNAGKSTLLNALSGANVLAEDKLFATLDPVMRKIDLPENRDCLLVDTVGFIRKLPHQLVEAFKSTLEETLCADLILIVSDASSDQCAEQRAVVLDVLRQLGASGKPMLEVLNKCDSIPEKLMPTADALPISARTGEGLEELREAISKRISSLRHRVRMVIPYSQGNILSLIHERGQIVSEDYGAEGTEIICMLDGALYQKVQKMMRGGVIELA